MTQSPHPTSRAGQGEPGLTEIVEAAIGRLLAGESVDVEALAVDYPRHAEEIRDLVPAARDLMRLCESPAAPHSWPSLITASGDEAADRRLGDFRIIRELGRGGMGTVYEAEQLSMGRRVALKVLPFAALAHSKAIGRFRNEVRAAAALDHANIVSVFSVGEERGVHYYAMQLIRGQSLAALIEQLRSENHTDAPTGNDVPTIDPVAPQTTRPIAHAQASTATVRRRDAERFREVARLGAKAASALQHAHDLGVLHRDVKPANLMLDQDGELYITDFGLARIQSDVGLTMTGDVIGTLRYMAPEQALAKRVVVDHRADVYSLGATLYELLTLQPAFGETDRGELLKQIAFEEPAPLRAIDPRIPAELEVIVRKSMAKEPAERYPSAHALAEDLRAFLDHRPIAARPPSPSERLRKWSRRHQQFVTAGGLALVALCIGLAISVGVIRRAQQQTLAALNEKSELLYIADMATAYQAMEIGSTNEVRAILDRYPAATIDGGIPLERRLLEFQLQAPLPVTIQSRHGAISEFAVFNDQRRVVSVGTDGKARVWDVHQRRLLREFSVCDGALTAVAVSPDSRFIAVGSGIAEYLPIASPEAPPTLTRATPRDEVAPAGDRYAVFLCDLESDEAPRKLWIAPASVEAVAFSPDGTRLVAGVRYEQLCLLTLQGRVVRSIPCAARAETVEFIPRSNLILAPNRRDVGQTRPLGLGQAWSEDLGTVKREFVRPANSIPGDFTCLRASPDGRLIAAGDKYRGQVILLDADTGHVVGRAQSSRDRLNVIAFAQDGTAIAAAYRDGRVEVSELFFTKDKTTPSLQRPLGLNAHSGDVTGVAFLDESRLVTAGSDGLLRIWSRPTAPAAQYEAPHAKLINAALSPDGTMALCCCQNGFSLIDLHDGNFRLKETDPGATFRFPIWSARGNHAAMLRRNQDECVVVIDVAKRSTRQLGYTHNLYATALSPDGATVALVGDGPLVLADAQHGRRLLQTELKSPALRVAFSPDGRCLAVPTKGGRIELIARDTLAVTETRFCQSDVASLAFHPAGTMLATGHGDSIIRIWALDRDRPPLQLLGHARQVTSLQFSADGRTLLSSADDGTVRIWSAPHARPLGIVSRTANPAQENSFCAVTLSRDEQVMMIAPVLSSHDRAHRLSVWSLRDVIEDPR